MPPDAADLRFPFHSPHPLEPPREYAVLRATQPVAKATLPGGAPVWLVTRYDDVRKVFTDPRLSRQAITASDAPRVFPITATGSQMIAVMDPPEHTRLRKLVAKMFTTSRIERLRPRVEELTEQMIGQLVAEGPPADLIAHVAEPLPITVICEHGRRRRWGARQPSQIPDHRLPTPERRGLRPTGADAAVRRAHGGERHRGAC